jgi:hypothetical protein
MTENTAPADELASIREQVRVLQRREAELRAVMLSDPGARVGKRFIASVKTASQRRVDADRLRRDYPATAEAVTDKITVQTVYLSGISEDGEIIPLLRGPHKAAFKRKFNPRRKRA